MRTVGSRVTAATSLSTVTSPLVTEVCKGAPLHRDEIELGPTDQRTSGRVALTVLRPNTLVSIAENDEQTTALSVPSALLEEIYKTLQLSGPRELEDRGLWVGPEHRAFEEPYGASA